MPYSFILIIFRPFAHGTGFTVDIRQYFDRGALVLLSSCLEIVWIGKLPYQFDLSEENVKPIRSSGQFALILKQPRPCDLSVL